MPVSDELHALLRIATGIAREAGGLVRAAAARAIAAGGIDTDSKTTPTDLVSAADREAERHLLDRLAELRPDDGVLGEEGAARTGSSGVRWVLDPIDGTVNFVYGLPPYAVSVAAERAGSTLVGCVHDASSGETFSAAAGLGAWLDGRPVGGRWRATGLDSALLGTGFSYDAGRRAAQGIVAAGVLPRAANLRQLGSAALGLCYVGAGRLDGYWEQGLAPWDRAAGLLVAVEAGAVVSGLRGRPPDGTLTLAGSPAVAPELVRLLEELRADEV